MKRFLLILHVLLTVFAWAPLQAQVNLNASQITSGTLPAGVALSPDNTSLRRERMRAQLRALLANVKQTPNWNSWAPASTASHAIPTVTQATSTSLGSGTTFLADPTNNLRDFNLLGADYRLAGGSYPLNSVVRGFGLDSTFSVVPIQAEFWTDAPVFELIVRQGAATGSRVRCFVNGQLSAPLGVLLTGTAGEFPRYVIHTFSSARTRLIRIEIDNSDINGIRVGSGYSVWPADPAHLHRPRCIVVSDSFGEGTGSAAGVLNSFVFRLAQATGWECWASGSGGTGYLNAGPNARKKFRDRIQTDVIAQRPDIVIIAGGINDSAYTQAEMTTESGLLFDTVLAGLPNAVVVALGPWCVNETPSGHYVTHRDAIRQSARQRGVLFVDNVAGAWISANNKQSFHPTGLTATATSAISGGGVSGVTVTSGGNGYSPYFIGRSVAFSGGGGSGAAGTLVLDGRIQSATVLAGGRGYDNTTTASISGGGGSGATASVTVSGGVVTGVTITAAGTGYTSQPSIVITGPAGSGGAVATVAQTYVVTGVTVTAPGTGYSSAPAVTIEAPSDGTHPTDAGHGYLAERLVFELPLAF